MIDVRKHGTTDETPVWQARLRSPTGMEVDILSLGATIRDWRVPVGNGLRSIVLGFDRMEPYLRYPTYFGAIVGRVASRIAGARFDMDGQTFRLDANDGPNMLHGGREGLSVQNWEMETDTNTNTVRLSHNSPDGHMGFPGAVDFSVTYRLTGNDLEITMEGLPDRRTPISMVQHNYFNLGRRPDILDHELWIDADLYSPYDANLLPTGHIAPVAESRFDFSAPRPVRRPGTSEHDLDVSYVLGADRSRGKPVARLRGEDGCVRLELFTDRPALQVYNSVTLDVPEHGSGGRYLGRYSGICLEDQMLPDALHHKNFPSIIRDPDRPYCHWCRFAIRTG